MVPRCPFSVRTASLFVGGTGELVLHELGQMCRAVTRIHVDLCPRSELYVVLHS